MSYFGSGDDLSFAIDTSTCLSMVLLLVSEGPLQVDGWETEGAREGGLRDYQF